MNKELIKYKGQFVKGQPKKLPRPANPQIQSITLYKGKISNKAGCE